MAPGAMELKERDDDKLKTPHAIEAAAEVEAARRSFKKKANRNSVIKRLEAASSSGVDAVSLLLVRRPKAVIFGVIFLTILGVGVTVACNFSLSKPTEYDWCACQGCRAWSSPRRPPRRPRSTPCS